MPKEYAEGTTVEHHIFGKGRVLSADLSRRTVRVQFENVKMPRNLSQDYFAETHDGRPVTEEKAEPENEDFPVPGRIPEQFFRQPEISELKKPTRSKNKSRRTPAPLTEDASVDESVDRSGAVEIDPMLSEKLRQADNLWKRDDVPQDGWICTGVTDLGTPAGICEMCGQQIIRYAHHMAHPHYRQLVAGCVCASRMVGDVDAARKRESEFKNRMARKESFLRRSWKRSANGNPYLKIKDHLLILYRNKDGGGWKYAIDSAFSDKSYSSRAEAVLAVFDALEKVLYPA